MDIVDDLRKDPYEEERQYKREARLELGNMLDKAADEIVKLREALLDAAGFVSRADTIGQLRGQLKLLQDDAMGDVKTIDNLSKMAARYRKGLDRIYNLHNSGDEYSEREINDMTYEIVVTAIAGTLYDKGPRLDDRGDNLDGN